jgi:hypothetical protein
MAVEEMARRDLAKMAAGHTDPSGRADTERALARSAWAVGLGAAGLFCAGPVAFTAALGALGLRFP